MNWTKQRNFMAQMNGAPEAINGTNSLSDDLLTDNYQSGFRGGMVGSVFVNRPDYNNPNNILHNNVHDRVILDQYFDNKIFIDSSFSDHSINPDPFKFVVKFNAIEPKKEIVSTTINEHTFSYYKYIDGDRDVVFDRAFKNIRYVTVEALFFPSSINYVTGEHGEYVPNLKLLFKQEHKYIVLKINELRNGHCFSNNPCIGDDSFIMKMDKDICIMNYVWIPFNRSVCYFDSNLKKIDRLTIEICNHDGKRLCPTLNEQPFDFFADYRKTIDTVNKLNRGNNSKDEIEKLLPKLLSLKKITESLSPELYLSFNALDPQINTSPKY
jgi:hypothetical protein